MIVDHIPAPAAGQNRAAPSRRGFLQAAAVFGGGLLLSLRLPLADNEAEAEAGDSFTPNAFIRVTADGQIVLTMPYIEMGQGTYTAIPMLLAEELEVELKQVRLEHAPPDPKLYGNPLLGGEQATGNSNAVRASWEPLRQAGAIARTMLITAAAKRWNVEPDSCRAQTGEVLHASTGRRAKYGELATDAARLPVPEKIALKKPQEFRLIGTPAKRLDAAPKVNGTAVYGIDVRNAGREDRNPGAAAGLRRPREDRGRYRGQGGHGRAPDRSPRRRRSGGRRPYGRSEEGSRRAGYRMG